MKASVPNVCHYIFEASQPFVLPAPWDFLPAHPAYRRLPEDRAMLLQRITTQFPVDELLQLGLVKRNPDNTLRLHRTIAESQSPFLAIRDSARKSVSGLLVEMNYFGPNSVAGDHLVRIARQFATMNSVPKHLILAPSMVDASIFAAQGLATVPTRSLESMTATAFRQVLDLQYLECSPGPSHCVRQQRQLSDFGHVSADRPPFSTKVTTQLVIPACEAADADPKQLAVEHTLNFVRQLVRQFPSHRFNFAVWRRSDATRERLEWQVRHDLPANRVATVRRSLESECVNIQEMEAPPKIPSVELHKSIHELAVLDRKGAATTEKRQAWQQLLAWQGEARVDPLRRQAQATDDPLYREQLEVLADLASMALPQMQAETQRLRMEAEDIYLNGATSLHNHRISAAATRNALNVINKYTSTLKEIISCRQARARNKTRHSSPAGQRGSRFQRPRSPR